MGGKGSGAKPKNYDPNLVDQVAKLYGSGMTQDEVAAALGTTRKIVWRVMYRYGIKARPAIKRNQEGPANSSWRGDRAGYQALHARLYRTLGKPSYCVRCDSKDDPQVVYEWANLTGNYADINDYERMCRSCHRRYDNARRAA
jgi:hypothetical protein